MISVIDYGMGNCGSVVNMIRKIGGEARIVSTYEDVLTSKKLVLPGVGSFDAGMQSLDTSRISQAIKSALDKPDVKLLGICLGMQLLLETSQEGIRPGLGLVKGHVKKFVLADKKMKIPHMGWNVVKAIGDAPLLDSSCEELRFYFVHSYYVDCDEKSDIAGVTSYGHDFVSALQKGNIFGLQFHPEKSHQFGMEVFRRYLNI